MEGLGKKVLAAARVALAGDAVSVMPDDCGLLRWPGAYVLLIRLDESQPVRFAGRRGRLDAGWFAYVGSALGPGGVGARVARHLALTKKPHWHVDALTLVASHVQALAQRDGDECDLAGGLCARGAFGHVLPGFGSSDCRSCQSHLLAWND